MKNKKKKVELSIFQEAVLPMLETKHAENTALQAAIDDGYDIFELAEDDKETPIQFKVSAAKAVEKAVDTTVETVERLVEKRLKEEQEKANKENSGRIIVGNDRRGEDPCRGFKSFKRGGFGEMLQSIFLASEPGNGPIDERLRIIKSLDKTPIGQKAISGLGTDAGSGAGFLNPPEFAKEIWDGMNAAPDSLMARTDNYPIEGESLTFPANAETSRANGSRYGGVQGFWRAEAAQMTSSKPTFREVTLKPHELYVFAYVTNNMLRQGSSLQSYVQRVASEEIDFKIGDSIINGTGAGQPMGILNAGCKIQVSKESSQDAATIKGTNILKMWARMHAKRRRNAVWLVNQDVEPQLYGMSWVAVGNTGTALNSYLPFVPAGGPMGNAYPLLMGAPVLPCEYCATLGTVGDIILADGKAYATGQRGQVLADTSMHIRFDYGETAFRFTFEVDGTPWLAAPITPFKGTNTLSPFVVLQTR